MKSVRIPLLLSGIALIAVPATSAWAQGAAPTDAPAADAVPADTSPADAARAEAAGEIVVTAQRRDERLQDVPITIQAFTATTLEQSGVTQADDLPTVVPGMTFGRSAGGSVPFIRGIGAIDATAGQEAPVSTYVDGVYIQSLYSNNLALKNVARVEVLKGPQGTLFGRNATGGLIHIITKDPSSTPSGEFELSAGNYQTYTVGGYATTGIAGDLAADVAFHVRRQEKGYGKNLLTGNDTNFHNEKLIRSKWKYRGESTAVTLIGDYTNIDAAQGLNRTFSRGLSAKLETVTPAASTTLITT